MVVKAVVGFDLGAFELVIHDEVDHTRDRIGSIDCRCPAGQHFNALDEWRRNLVQVRRIVGYRPRRQAPAVLQHQGANRASAAQIHRGGAACAVRDVAALIGEYLRQIVEQAFRRPRALEPDVLGANDSHGARALEVGRRNARTRDFEAFAWSVLSEGSPCGNQRHRHPGSKCPGKRQRQFLWSDFHCITPIKVWSLAWMAPEAVPGRQLRGLRSPSGTHCDITAHRIRAATKSRGCYNGRNSIVANLPPC